MLSQFMTNDRHQKNKKFLGDLHDFPDGCMAVGRLDETSEGLLLITTDGQLSSHINKKGKVEKEYYAQVDGIISDEAVQKMTSGIEISINGSLYQTKECKARIIEDIPDLPETLQRIRDERHGPTSWVSVTLKEGKFRQVRKMCAAVGFPVLRLARVRIGDFTVKSLNYKTVKEVTNQLD
ncbi:pseudouridine synthase [Nonlabens dokdonensis DSW-6]|uniref:Pseudouridine synthase n=3 Tax=Nonlabens dokdonensis TaxID=328515 RepID=L7WD57_NONDD|nr:pseudouridine synthase [Nonlabens dokdonensis DSW-6]